MSQTKPPVLIVHGFLSSHQMMRPLKWALEKRGRTVFLTPLSPFCIQDVMTKKGNQPGLARPVSAVGPSLVIFSGWA